MPGFFDDLAVPIPCEKCGHKSRQEVRRLQGSPDFTCPRCGSVNEIDPAQFREQLRRLEQALDNFGEAILKTVKFR